MASDLSADPFHESDTLLGTRRMRLLGGDFHFDSNCEALLDLVDQAFGGLPAHRLLGKPPRFNVSLRLLPRGTRERPPRPAALAGAGLLGAVTSRSNGVLLSPATRSALVLVSADMLARAYHVRYEYLEFAVYTLASRALGLLALHGACIGRDGRGVLALGDSGAGKTTLALHALLAGYEVLAEDAVFVEPARLLATAVSNFVHVRPASLRFLDPAHRMLIRRAPTIRRRSGLTKFELDMRQPAFALAARALRLRALLLLSPRVAGRGRSLLRSLAPDEALQRFMRTQPYAVRQPGFAQFHRQLRRLPCFELRRGAHPDESLPVLGELLRQR
jgi:hypothetical protein